MTGDPTRHHPPYRLDGLEPDNLLAFLALLGLLKTLDHARPEWRPRVQWSLDEPPLRPLLTLRTVVASAEICDAAAEGLADLAIAHDFSGKADLNHTIAEARALLEGARLAGGYRAALAAALFSDAAIKIEQGKSTDRIEATPLCLLFRQGHQHFLQRLAAVPNQPAPPLRGRGKKAVQLSASECLAEALFSPWARPDATFSFRWDPAEDVRYALMFGDPSNAANKDGTQHGANRLAAVGLSLLTAIPEQRGEHVRLGTSGGQWARGFALTWPIWRSALSLQSIAALMSQPALRESEDHERLGIDHVREARRISVGRFMNFTVARTLESGAAPL